MAQTPALNQSPTFAQSIEGQTRAAQTQADNTAAVKAGKEITPKADTKGVAKADNFSEFGTDLAKTVPVQPSVAQDIDHLLSSYMSELNNMGPEYQAEMNFLAPYISGNNNSLEQSVAKTYGGSGVLPQANDPAQLAMQTAEANTAKAVENQPTPGFGQIASEMGQYEKSIPYQAPIDAALAYQKYLSTYGGSPPNEAGWPASVQGAYSAISGSSAANPLGSPQQAATNLAAQNKANQLLTGQSTTGTGQTA